MNPLIITAAPNICWLQPDVVYPHSVEEIAADWNMRYLIDRGLLPAPYFTTLFFGWPGGSRSPPMLEEYLYRRRLMPPGSIINISIMGPEQKTILAAAILNGDHIRVGTED